ncbi:hypothetical protein B7P43_G00561 [Cryptotermes secundus]|uniref:Uncharacterized protein n=1 Tax=Cryptotermes secundus TaxID=105785 RepID=A0A2J7QY27_9NEOP|nr:hypothetical protein B7P43_G00561 [Cryptotermes secundus]
MSEGTVRQCCRMFKDGRTNVHFEERSGRPSVLSDDLVQTVDQKICISRRFTSSEVSCELPQISHTLLYRMASSLTCLERDYKDGDELLSHVVRVTGDETCVSFVNAETEEQSKQWIYTKLPKMMKKFKQTSVCQKADGNCFLEHERSVYSGIHAKRDDNNVRSVLRRNCLRPLRTKGMECLQTV